MRASDSGVVTTVSRQPRRPQAHERAARVDDDVTDLAGGMGRPGEQLVVDHEAGTDALGDAHEQDVSRFAGDECQLTEGGGVGVVGNPHGQPEGGGQLWTEGDVVEAEVRGAHDDAVGVDDAGRCHADTEQGAVSLTGQLAGDLDGRRGEALAGQLLPRTLAKAPTATGDDLARQVDDGPTNLAGAEVEADDVPGVGDD